MALPYNIPARGALGCVLTADAGIYEVWTSRGLERVSMGGALLAAVARDPEARPGPGDWVELNRWVDGRVTLTGCASSASQERPRLRLVR